MVYCYVCAAVHACMCVCVCGVCTMCLENIVEIMSVAHVHVASNTILGAERQRIKIKRPREAQQ